MSHLIINNRFSICDFPQKTPEWFAVRLGRVTSSGAANVLAKIKSGEAAGRMNYRFRLVTERLTGVSQEDDFQTKEMARGNEIEPMARLEYEAQTGLVVRETGFLSMVDYPAGCSCDGDIDDFTGIVGFKCPNTATHIEYMRRNRLPPVYSAQATHEMWVTGAKWYDFVSFDPRLPEEIQYFCVRIFREEFGIDYYEKELLSFFSDVDVELESIKAMIKVKKIKA